MSTTPLVPSLTKPTIGRVVWLWYMSSISNDVAILDNFQAIKAEVCFVNPDGSVTLNVCDHEAEFSTEEDVFLFEPHENMQHNYDLAHTHLDLYATWMPYQSKKHAEEKLAG